MTRHRQVKRCGERKKDSNYQYDLKIDEERKKREEGEDDDHNDDGDLSRLIAINICVCVYTRHAKEKKMSRCIITKESDRKSREALNFFFSVSVIYVYAQYKQ